MSAAAIRRTGYTRCRENKPRITRRLSAQALHRWSDARVCSLGRERRDDRLVMAVGVKPVPGERDRQPAAHPDQLQRELRRHARSIVDREIGPLMERTGGTLEEDARFRETAAPEGGHPDRLEVAGPA